MKRLQPKDLLLACSPVVGAALLYVVGIKFLFIPVIVASFVWLLPFPRLFNSMLSKIFIAVMLMYGVLQLAIVAQFCLIPQSDFRALLFFTALFSIAIIIYSKTRHKQKVVLSKWLDRKDIIALCVALCFVLPLGIYSYGQKGLTHIVAMAAVQVPDATNHFISMSDMYKTQHIPRQMGYYPKGFDLGTSFIQDSFGINQTTAEWSSNARLFMGQYIIFGAALAYSLAYLGYLLFEKLSDQAYAARKSWLLIVALGLPLALFYLVPFVFEGFLNFCYVCATIVCSFIYLDAINETDQESLSRWYLLGYLLLAFGSSMSWPLLTPPLLLVPVLYFWPRHFQFKQLYSWLAELKNLPIIAGFAIQLVPLYIDYKYSTPGSNSLNTPGALSVFHWGILGVGLLLVSYMLISKNFDEQYKRFIKSMFVPFIALTAILVFYQDMTVGQPIYYSIKSAYILEVLVLTLATGWLAVLFSKSTFSTIENLFIVSAMPLLAGMVLVGVSGNNPFDDVRRLVREYSHYGKPAFFDSDVQSITTLGAKGDIKQFNVTILHYDSVGSKLFANMQPAYWANAVHYDDNPANGSCSIGSMYGTAMYEAFSSQQQNELVGQVKSCIRLAQRNREAYYIVTDSASVGYLQQIFSGATYVY